MSGLYTPYAFNADTTFTLGNVQTQSLSPGAELMVARTGGSLDPSLVAAAYIEPKAQISTPDLATLLGASGVSLRFGKAFSTAWKLQFQARASLGGAGDFLGTGNHLVASGTKAFLVVDSLTADTDNKVGASAQCSLLPVSVDGQTTAMTIAADASLSGSIALGKTFGLGPVLCEGLTGGLGGVQKVTINTGLQPRPDRENGLTFPTRYTLGPRNPMFEVDAKNGAIAALLGIISGASTGMTVYFQRMAHGSDRYGFEASEHVAVGFSTGAYTTREIGVDNEGDAITRLTATITGVLSWSVDTAIVVP